MIESYNDVINEYLHLINSVEANITNKVINECFVIKEKQIVETRSARIAHSAPEVQPYRIFEQALPPLGQTVRNDVSPSPQSQVQNESDKPILTPSMLKREFLKCDRCALSNRANRVLGEGCDFRPLVFILTDTLLRDDERAYLDTILKAFHLNTTTNAYITSLVKCHAESKEIPPEAYVKCSRFLKMQFMLYRPLSSIAFGPSSSAFLESLKNKDEFKNTAFITTLPLFELKNNKDEKKKLITSFNQVARILNIARV